jgi:hypothetical protein
MDRKKRAFFIIGHNPNSIQEAKEFLDNGANALEPDIVCADGQFYVSHLPHLSYTNVPTLPEYLQQLKALLVEGQYNLALIIWDIKTVNFEPNHFIHVVKENFSGEIMDGIAMLITHSDDHEFLNRYTGHFANVGVGLDESNLQASDIESIFINANQKNFSYADGITTVLKKPAVYKNITDALFCRYENEPHSFGLIYTWVMKKESSLRKFLDIYIDGIMVDVGTVGLLKKLIVHSPYNEVYDLAQNGYNPFAAAPIPKYKLSIETKDELMAGTDAQILFTLSGVGGQSLKRLPFDGRVTGALERGSITNILVEGFDLGEIKCLEVKALPDGIAAAWLPGTIAIESPTKEKVKFIFNSTAPKEWITKKGGSITKFPAP